jgi:hypothetical protein
MPLAQIPLDCEPHVIADWFEFYVLNSDPMLGNFHDIQRMWDRRRNAEESAPDGTREESAAHDGDERFVETILSEIRDRTKVLGDTYPFEFSDSGAGLRIREEMGVGNVVYLFCLLLSNAKRAEIFEIAKFSYDLDNRVRDLFQACSTWAAAGVVNGSAFSFGFPRPDGSGFLEKLHAVYGVVGEGRVRDNPLPGVSSSPKDEGVDVIAWAHRPDDGPGRQYILGQVATGQNWPGKSIVEYIRSFHENWFSEIPASVPTEALFIPYCISLSGGATFTEQLAILTKRYGSVYYRCVIPKFAAEGYRLAEAGGGITVERTNDLANIREWVMGTIRVMRSIAMA